MIVPADISRDFVLCEVDRASCKHEAPLVSISLQLRRNRAWYVHSLSTDRQVTDEVVGYAISEESYMEAVNALGAIRRALPNSPQGYTPSYVACPSEPPSIRLGSRMSPNETAWVQKRRNNTVSSMRDFLTRMNISGFDAASYINTHENNASALPNIGIAFSGGGWRALMNGAGALEAFDSRTPNSTAAGHLGGLLQSATYVAGLSGGGWLVGSIYVNNFTTVTAARDETSGSLWEFGNSVLKGPDTGGIQIFDSAQYYANIASDVHGKEDAGFNVSLTDVWGRALSYQLINATAGGESYTFSSIALTDGFQNADQPMPVLVSDGRAPGQVIISANSTIYEFNPFEMGSWDATVYGFMPTKYIGTSMTAGQVSAGAQCVVGFDNAGFVMGTSSSLFNQILLQVNSTSIPDIFKTLVTDVFGALSRSDDDIADYQPNPFYGWMNDTNYNANSSQLTLVDGGEDLQNIPFYPLIQPARAVDVIFAIDSSADNVYSWPNGTSLVATFERSQQPIANGTGFPYVPDVNTIVNLGLNTRPTFFGCDPTNVTHSGTEVPLVVYLPNSPYVTYSNISTFQLSTNDTQRDAIILNGYDVATMANGTRDSTWPTCIACAVLSRSMYRTGTQVPSACTACFKKFCWDGTLNSTTPNAYAPTPILAQVKLTSDALRSRSLQTVVAVVVASVLALGFSF